MVQPMDGPALRRLRRRARLTQRALATRLGVAENTVARWERNEVTISEPMTRLIRLTLAPKKSKSRGD